MRAFGASLSRRRREDQPSDARRFSNGFSSLSGHCFHSKPAARNVLRRASPYSCYHFELVAEIGTTRGGDGGEIICGGAGFFMGWLTLATAYFEEDCCKHDPTERLLPRYYIGRRVLDLSS